MNWSVSRPTGKRKTFSQLLPTVIDHGLASSNRKERKSTLWERNRPNGSSGPSSRPSPQLFPRRDYHYSKAHGKRQKNDESKAKPNAKDSALGAWIGSDVKVKIDNIEAKVKRSRGDGSKDTMDLSAADAVSASATWTAAAEALAQQAAAQLGGGLTAPLDDGMWFVHLPAPSVPTSDEANAIEARCQRLETQAAAAAVEAAESQRQVSDKINKGGHEAAE